MIEMDTYTGLQPVVGYPLRCVFFLSRADQEAMEVLAGIFLASCLGALTLEVFTFKVSV